MWPHYISAIRRRDHRLIALAILMSAVVVLRPLGTSSAIAAISSSGDIAPVPPAAGGAFAGPFEIGDVDVGTVSIIGGTAISHTGAAVLGDTVTGIGIVNMSGLGSDWTLTSSGADLTVANNGTGSLNLSNLAFLTVLDDLFVAGQLNSLGEISINGMGTIVDIGDAANIGQRGQAIIEITNGGRLITNQNIIGDEPAGDGRVTVRDPLSLWRTTNSITIADAGRARMEVLGGGRIESTAPSGILSAVIAAQAGSTGAVEVSGTGSIWQNALGLVVGDFGDGSLVVAEEGRVSLGTGADIFAIGRQIGSIGRVEVRGRNSLLTAASTEVGDSGDGTLHILDGAQRGHGHGANRRQLERTRAGAHRWRGISLGSHGRDQHFHSRRSAPHDFQRRIGAEQQPNAVRTAWTAVALGRAARDWRHGRTGE